MWATGVAGVAREHDGLSGDDLIAEGDGMRTNAVGVFDGIGRVTTTVPGGTFLVLLVLLIALLFLWFVLMLRDSLIHLVVVLASAFDRPGG